MSYGLWAACRGRCEVTGSFTLMSDMEGRWWGSEETWFSSGIPYEFIYG